jgi:hypothetical protein
MLPYRNCTLDYLREILSGKKALLHNSQVVIPDLPKLRSLSLNRVLERIKRSDTAMRYMPGDKTNIKPAMLTFGYAVAVVNTLDRQFF